MYEKLYDDKYEIDIYDMGKYRQVLLIFIKNVI